ncbi:curlin [Vibrio diazotrophicus]|uniref:curlin n=1 Tax=Vibrio diazotrophicus TaxID=685 RepID=UPI00142E1445|nr:curlin [Vibrio diazotrophicus]NIY90796.1 curlin [Vibrio diazotrophicus]
MKTKLALVIAATLTSTTVLANNTADVNMFMTSDSEVTVFQQSPNEGNTAEIKSYFVGNDSALSISQVGGTNDAKILAVEVDHGDFSIDQTGDLNKALIKTEPVFFDNYKDDVVSITQSGTDNNSEVLLKGGTDEANVELNVVGTLNETSVVLNMGDHSTVTGVVDGNSNMADVYVDDSSDNTIAFEQTGDSNNIDVDVTGMSDNNNLDITQTSSNAIANVAVYWGSTDNIINVTQTYGDVANVNVGASTNNVVTVTQY